MESDLEDRIPRNVPGLTYTKGPSEAYKSFVKSVNSPEFRARIEEIRRKEIEDWAYLKDKLVGYEWSD
jgi:hypothetical protein